MNQISHKESSNKVKTQARNGTRGGAAVDFFCPYLRQASPM
jgi:hypothetical protein